MEGPLSKWTNVMKGWQYRWFVLDDSAGLLSYYTSKEKMVRGARRGCVRLKGAVVGIDDDDDSTFTITVDAKTFHFQAHDADEREKWIRALEDTVLRHAAAQRRWDPNQPLPTMADFDRKLTESDAYLQLLIDQSNSLERMCSATEDPNNKARGQLILSNLNQVLESIKHCIVLLQIAKNTAFPMNGVYHPCNSTPEVSHRQFERDELSRSSEGSSHLDGISTSSVPIAQVQTGIEVGRECGENVTISMRYSDMPGSGNALMLPTNVVPNVSYSSSEDEDFFDANDYDGIPSQPSSSHGGPRFFEDAVENLGGENAPLNLAPTASHHQNYASALHDKGVIDSPSYGSREFQNSHDEKLLSENVPAVDQMLDYDSMYDEEDEELGSLEGHGSVIQHLISQVKIGMDLTRVALPTFILERRSLLEMYADFFAHPDLFCSIVNYTDPKDRMVQVLRWYLSAFHAGRKSEVARKPYNPILGEVFRCYWDLPDDTNQSSKPLVPDGPVPWATSDQLSFVAEQVSHHPPVSAFYAEHKEKRISFCGHIWTKSKFLGLSVCVNNIGQGCVSLLDLDEEYILNFPSGYGRSILTVPWVELGGTCQITCSKTGYSATVEFLTKPFYGGKKHRISAEAWSPGEKKPFLVVEGEWNGNMIAKWNDGRTEGFIDTLSLPMIKKCVKPVLEQEENESRYLWKEVTAGLKFNNINKATGAKVTLEQKQRDEAKIRKEMGEEWQTKLFSLEGENWVYNLPLQQRS